MFVITYKNILKVGQFREGNEFHIIGANFSKVDVGEAGTWVLNMYGTKLFALRGTFGDNYSQNYSPTEFLEVPLPPNITTLTSISSGKTVIVVTTSDGQLWIRTGITQNNLLGEEWLKINGHMSQAEVYETDSNVVIAATSLIRPDHIFKDVLIKNFSKNPSKGISGLPPDEFRFEGDIQRSYECGIQHSYGYESKIHNRKHLIMKIQPFNAPGVSVVMDKLGLTLR